MTMETAAQTELLPEVRKFLDKKIHGALIGGVEVMASDGGTFDTHDPGSGENLATVANLTAEDVEHAVSAAQEAFDESDWAKMPVNERSVFLHRLADEVEKRKAIIAQIESLDCGKIYEQAVADVENFIETHRYFAELAQNLELRTVIAVKGHEAAVVRHPWGPCGFIIPWNFPFLLCGWGIAPATAAGNTCVVKPAEDTPLSTLYVAHLAKEIGYPDGVINVIPGLGEQTGAALSENPNLKRMSFTGSPEVGRMVASNCGGNLIPVKLELGGKGAAVIFNDVDINDAAEKLVGAITFHTGQVCCDATRWLIQRDIYDDFINAAVERLKAVKIGHQMDDGTQMGPVVSEVQRNRVLGYLEKGAAGGAEILLEGGAAEVSGRTGQYVKPALLAGPLDNVAAREEIFGPVAYCAPFGDEAEGVRLANDTEYGLANSVWSSDLARCRRVAESFDAGNGWINAHNVVVHGVPYAGVKKSGMGGGVVSLETLLDYYRNISVIRPL
jgi:aldehyde dehydrogenase (NAD+)